MLSLLLRRTMRKTAVRLGYMSRTLKCGKAKDFITAVDEKNIIVVKELELKEGYQEIGEDSRRISMIALKSEGEEDIHDRIWYDR